MLLVNIKQSHSKVKLFLSCILVEYGLCKSFKATLRNFVHINNSCCDNCTAANADGTAAS